MRPKHKAFRYGYEFSGFGGQPAENLTQIAIPSKVTIPLKQGFGNEAGPIVKTGQQVKAGEIIARNDQSVSNPVHSSVNGTVVSTEDGKITIDSDGSDGWQKLDGHSPEWQKLSAEKTGELIYLSGAGASGKCGIPTAFNSSIIAPNEVEDIIVQGINAETYNISLDVVLEGEQLSNFIDGLNILKKLMTSAKLHLVLDKSQQSLISKISQSPGIDDSINLFTTNPKYPASRDEVLVPLLLGKKFPYDYSAANIGVIVLDIPTVLDVYYAVTEGRPLIEKTIALCGPGFTENAHVRFRIGSWLEHITADKIDTDKNLRLVLNSCMTGEKLTDLSMPADRTASTVIAMIEDDKSEFFSFARPGFNRDSYSRTCISGLFKKDRKSLLKKCGTNVHGELRPCLSCGFCTEVCPADIIPHLLFKYAERDIIDEDLLRYRIFDCIECNLCDYVCPSKISISEFIKKGKARLIEEGFKQPVPVGKLKGAEKFKSIT